MAKTKGCDDIERCNVCGKRAKIAMADLHMGLYLCGRCQVQGWWLTVESVAVFKQRDDDVARFEAPHEITYKQRLHVEQFRDD